MKLNKNPVYNQSLSDYGGPTVAKQQKTNKQAKDPSYLYHVPSHDAGVAALQTLSHEFSLVQLLPSVQKTVRIILRSPTLEQKRQTSNSYFCFFSWLQTVLSFIQNEYSGKTLKHVTERSLVK